MKRRSAIALVVVVALLLLSALALRWAMRPQVLGPRVMALAGQATELDISADEFDYRLRGTPQLVVRGVSARLPGGAEPLLEAERVFVSVPWSTLRSRGANLLITRIEIDGPRVQLQSALSWWAQRPRGDGPLPTLAEGLHVRQGLLQADGWTIEDLSIHLPRFAPQARLGADVSGRYLTETLRAPFRLHVVMTHPATGAGIGVAGIFTLQAERWELPARAVLSTRLEELPAGAGFRLAGLRVSASAQHVTADQTSPFALGFAGEGAFADGTLTLDPAAIILRGQGLIPRLRGRGHLAVGQQLSLALTGEIERWPSAWPTLPAPFDDPDMPLPFELAYQGAPNLYDPLQLQLAREQARFEGRLRLPEVLSWVDGIASGSPLPPLEGRLVAPRVDIAGASLHGVEITIQDDPRQAEPQP
ncbi:hypothetical protein WCE55_13480 [Luteimonas sp. MJ293]|uniref:hypothetical protein n=1 Tax=Luteimonas sp. MJ146 TaxID=3129240 RepID=UPI0031BBBA58